MFGTLTNPIQPNESVKLSPHSLTPSKDIHNIYYGRYWQKFEIYKQVFDINIQGSFKLLIFNLDISFAVLLLQDGDEYKLADPICTFVFSILVIITTVRVLRDTLHVVMEGKCICFTCTLKLCQLLMSCHYSVLPSVALCVCNTMPMYGQ